MSSTADSEAQTEPAVSDRVPARSGLARWGVARLVTAEAAVFVLAVLGRMLPLLFSGNYLGNYGYDASVYYAAADGLIYGRTPYKDFVLLHPPGMMLFDTPFALLGRLTNDNIGFTVANYAIIAICGLTAVIVVRICKTMGLATWSAAVGGVVYALWFGSIVSEYLIRLEPLGNFFLALGILWLFKARAGETYRRLPEWGMPALAGVGFGLAESVKIWWIVPIAAIAGWLLLVERRWRLVAKAAAGFVAVSLVVDGPFLAIARGAMWHMIITDQTGRPANNHDPLYPYGFLVLGWRTIGMPKHHLEIVVVVGGLVMLAIAARSARLVAFRAIVLALMVQLVLLGVEPSWYTYYADFVAVPLALVVAGAVVPGRRERQWFARARPARWLAAPVFAVLLLAYLNEYTPSALITPIGRGQLAAAVRDYHCVVSDSPMVLININVLSRDFSRGCTNLVDLTGERFDLDRRLGFPSRGVSGHVWQSVMTTYLRSNDAVIIAKGASFLSLSPATMSAIEANGKIFEIGGISVYRTPH